MDSAHGLMDERERARRRFMRTGLGAAGVLMTLASQPGMATDMCATPSGTLSGGLQSHHGNAYACAGQSPGYWKNHRGWPAGCQPATPFPQVFAVDPAHAATYGSVSCGDIPSHQKFDESEPVDRRHQPLRAASGDQPPGRGHRQGHGGPCARGAGLDRVSPLRRGRGHHPCAAGAGARLHAGGRKRLQLPPVGARGSTRWRIWPTNARPSNSTTATWTTR